MNAPAKEPEATARTKANSADGDPAVLDPPGDLDRLSAVDGRAASERPGLFSVRQDVASIEPSPWSERPVASGMPSNGKLMQPIEPAAATGDPPSGRCPTQDRVHDDVANGRLPTHQRTGSRPASAGTRSVWPGPLPQPGTRRHLERYRMPRSPTSAAVTVPLRRSAGSWPGGSAAGRSSVQHASDRRRACHSVTPST